MTQSNSRNLPLLAVTLGDVAGIGRRSPPRC